VGVMTISGVTVAESPSPISAVGERFSVIGVEVGRFILSLRGSSQVKYKNQPTTFSTANMTRIIPIFNGEFFNESSISNPIYNK